MKEIIHNEAEGTQIETPRETLVRWARIGKEDIVQMVKPAYRESTETWYYLPTTSKANYLAPKLPN